MLKQKEVLAAYLQNMPKQFGWIKIISKLDSQNEMEELLSKLKENGGINDFRKKCSQTSIYIRTLEGLESIKNCTWEIKFSFSSVLKSKWVNLI